MWSDPVVQTERTAVLEWLVSLLRSASEVGALLVSFQHLRQKVPYRNSNGHQTNYVADLDFLLPTLTYNITGDAFPYNTNTWLYTFLQDDSSLYNENTL